jgi:hypothetical protein
VVKGVWQGRKSEKHMGGGQGVCGCALRSSYTSPGVEKLTVLSQKSSSSQKSYSFEFETVSYSISGTSPSTSSSGSSSTSSPSSSR